MSFQVSREGKTPLPHCLHTHGNPIRLNGTSAPCYKICKSAVATVCSKEIITFSVTQPYIKHFTRKCYWIVYFFAASYTASAKNVSISPLLRLTNNKDQDLAISISTIINFA